jgi:gamma-tubulin complex component 2
MDKGDFFLHFVEGSEKMMDTTVKNVNIEKLESYLDMAVRTSSTNADPFKDELSCTLCPLALIEQLFFIRNIKGALSKNAFGLQQLTTNPNGENDH